MASTLWPPPPPPHIIKLKLASRMYVKLSELITHTTFFELSVCVAAHGACMHMHMNMFY